MNNSSSQFFAQHEIRITWLIVDRFLFEFFCLKDPAFIVSFVFLTIASWHCNLQPMNDPHSPHYISYSGASYLYGKIATKLFFWPQPDPISINNALSATSISLLFRLDNTPLPYSDRIATLDPMPAELHSMPANLLHVAAEQSSSIPAWFSTYSGIKYSTTSGYLRIEAHPICLDASPIPTPQQDSLQHLLPPLQTLSSRIAHSISCNHAHHGRPFGLWPSTFWLCRSTSQCFLLKQLGKQCQAGHQQQQHSVALWHVPHTTGLHQQCSSLGHQWIPPNQPRLAPPPHDLKWRTCLF